VLAAAGCPDGRARRTAGGGRKAREGVEGPRVRGKRVGIVLSILGLFVCLFVWWLFVCALVCPFAWIDEYATRIISAVKRVGAIPARLLAHYSNLPTAAAAVLLTNLASVPLGSLLLHM
jgi:hypothetical protein